MESTALASNPAALNRKRKRSLKKYFWGMLFVTPALLVFIMFLWVPIFKGMIFSFYHIDFVKGDEFVGWKNYNVIFNDKDVMIAVKNTLYYIGLGLVIGFWVPCLFAIMISELRKFQGFARVAAYLPNVIPAVVLYGLWRWLYDSVGPINSALSSLGLDQIAFMTDTRWSMASLVFMETWQSFGAAMLIYLAAILNVPRDWYEAAEIDGAGIWQRIRHITLPSIGNVLLLMLILQLISSSQGYLSQYALLDGGPNKATLTYSLLIVKYAFNKLDYGVASALGVLMFIVLAGLAVIRYRLSGKEGSY
ncbi:sugar ABC transporter permease [Paenibacillaceae bacterium]|nr:sugar ABC transporter permease [Paenibacillaceae bacterium]